MGENIKRLKSCITDLRNKVEIAEERNRRAQRIMKIKEQRFEFVLEDMSLLRSKVTLMKEKLQKTYELLEDKHRQLEEVDEVLQSKTVICKELTRSETHNFQKNMALEIALNKTRARAMEYENKTKELKIRSQVYTREIQITNIAEMKAKRKFADLTSRIITRKELLGRLKIKEEQFHKREENFMNEIRSIDENIQEATTRAEAAERRMKLLKNKVSRLRQELLLQKTKNRKIFRLKNELEHLSLEY